MRDREVDGGSGVYGESKALLYDWRAENLLT